MRTVLATLMTTSALVLATPTLASQPPTTPDAGGDFSYLIGQLPVPMQQAITVRRDGTITKVTIDIVQLTQALRPMGITVLSKPLTLVFAPVGDGTFRQTDEAPIDVTVGLDSVGPQKQTGSFTYKGLTLSGVFDPKIAFYRTMSMSMTGVEGDLSQSDSGTSATVTFGPNGVQLTANDTANGLVDIKETQTGTGFAERVHVDPSKAASPKPGPAMDVDFKMPDVTAAFEINGWRAFAVRDFAAFLLANREKPSIAAKQQEFKQHVHDLVPLLNTAAIKAKAEHVLIQTPFGQGEVGSLGVEMGLDTATPSSSFKLGERFSRISIDTVFLPEWARTLVPTDVDLQVGASGFDIAGGLAKIDAALEQEDLSHPETNTTDFGALGKKAFLPNGGVHFDLLPSSVHAAAYSLSWHGGIDTTETSARIHADFSATGVDDVIKILSQVRDKGAPEAVIGLYAAKALAKPGPDGSMTWAVDFDPQGGVLVNGSPIGPKRP